MSGDGEAQPAKTAESATTVSEPAAPVDDAAKEAGSGWDADPSADMGVGTNGW